MAQIKLSQGFSDIKGKANGSVFASNKSGKYFRNNKYGGGTKTKIWNKQKLKFGSVSSLWKNLTLEEQEAWNLATSAFPQTNKVGDVIQLSGFNLFCKQNAMRLSNGYEITRAPLFTGEIPDMSDWSVTWNEDYQFLPASMIRLNSFDEETNSASYIIDTSETGLKYAENMVIVGNVVWNIGNNMTYPNSENLTVLSFSDDDENQLSIGIFRSNTGEDAVIVSQNDKYKVEKGNFFPKETLAGNTRAGVNSEQNLITIPFSVELAYGEEHISVKITVGVNTKLDFKVNYAGTLGTNINTVKVTNHVSNGQISAGFVNVAVKSDTAFVSEIQQVRFGYVPGTGWYLIPLNVLTEEKTNFRNALGVWSEIDVSGQPEIGLTTEKINGYKYPYISVLWSEFDWDNYFVDIYVSNPISSGKNGAYNRFRKIKTYDAEPTLYNSLGQAVFDTIGYIPSGCNLLFQIRAVERLTGISSQKAQRLEKSKIRFKSGQELSSNVN